MGGTWTGTKKMNKRCGHKLSRVLAKRGTEDASPSKMGGTSNETKNLNRRSSQLAKSGTKYAAPSQMGGTWNETKKSNKRYDSLHNMSSILAKSGTEDASPSKMGGTSNETKNLNRRYDFLHNLSSQSAKSGTGYAAPSKMGGTWNQTKKSNKRYDSLHNMSGVSAKSGTEDMASFKMEGAWNKRKELNRRYGSLHKIKMSSELAAKVRVVECSKCRELLIEYPHFVIYKCGVCGATLQAKKRSEDVKCKKENGECREEQLGHFTLSAGEQKNQMEINRSQSISKSSSTENLVSETDNISRITAPKPVSSPDEQPTQAQTSNNHSFDRVRSVDAFDNTEITNPSSELSGTLAERSESPTTRRSHGSALRTVNLDDFSPSLAAGSSVVSLKEGCGSSFSSSSHSKSESYNPSINHYHGLPVNTDDKGLLQEIEPKEESAGLEQQNHLAAEDIADNILWDKENISHEELLIKFIKNEKELKISNLKLQVSEKEMGSLKSQIERSEGQLNHLLKELKMREADLKYEKGQFLELQKQTADLETHVSDCCCKIAKSEEALEVAREELKISNDEIARLRNELDRSSDVTHQLQRQLEAAQQYVATFKAQLDTGRKLIQDLEDWILWFKVNESSLKLEMQNLNVEIRDSQSQFFLGKEQLQSEISSLSKEKIQLDSRLKELESRSNSLENKVMEYEAEKVKLEELHSAHQMVLQDEISLLKEELDERKHGIESLNKQCDRQHKYHMLMRGKVGANAKIHKLKPE